MLDTHWRAVFSGPPTPTICWLPLTVLMPLAVSQLMILCVCFTPGHFNSWWPVYFFWSLQLMSCSGAATSVCNNLFSNHYFRCHQWKLFTWWYSSECQKDEQLHVIPFQQWFQSPHSPRMSLSPRTTLVPPHSEISLAFTLTGWTSPPFPLPPHLTVTAAACNFPGRMLPPLPSFYCTPLNQCFLNLVQTWF